MNEARDIPESSERWFVISCSVDIQLETGRRLIANYYKPNQMKVFLENAPPVEYQWSQQGQKKPWTLKLSLSTNFTISSPSAYIPLTFSTAVSGLRDRADIST